jgi:hypothetical protein
VVAVTWHPALDDIEAGMYEADVRARFGGARWRDNREPSTRQTAIGCPGCCWCGDRRGHDWPGKAGGAPHPRGGRP